jgi:hypothetical protein
LGSEALLKTYWISLGNEYYYYECEIPTYCLRVTAKIKNSYITTEKSVDGNLESEVMFISDELWNCTQYSLKVEVVLINGFKQNLIEEIGIIIKQTLKKDLKNINCLKM